MATECSVLIIDDDPTHLYIYSQILRSAGYRALPALVTASHIDMPEEPGDLVLLDYHLAGQISAVDVAKQVRAKLPRAPILVLSDVYALPDDIAPYVEGFLRKGQPSELVNTLKKLFAAKDMMTQPAEG